MRASAVARCSANAWNCPWTLVWSCPWTERECTWPARDCIWRSSAERDCIWRSSAEASARAPISCACAHSASRRAATAESDADARKPVGSLSEVSRKSLGSPTPTPRVSEGARKSLGSGPAPPPSPAHPPTRSTEGRRRAAASSWAEARPPRTVPKASTRHGGRPPRRLARRPVNGPMARPGVNGPLARAGVNVCPSCEAVTRTRRWASWWARRCLLAVPGVRCSGRWVGVAHSTEARAVAKGGAHRLHAGRRAAPLSPSSARRLLPPQRQPRYPPARRQRSRPPRRPRPRPRKCARHSARARALATRG